MSREEDLAVVEEYERRRAIASLAEFVRQGWPVVEPGAPLVWSWHLDIICDALERQTRGEAEYRKLLIMVPPGTMKSLLVSVFHPAWQWLYEPERRKMFLAADEELTIRDSRRTRDLIRSEWYQGLMSAARRRKGLAPWELRADQDSVVNFANTAGGFRVCQSLGSKLTGKRADDVVIDDPVDAKSVVLGGADQIRKRMDDVAAIIDKSLPSRVNSLADARWTIIMQRLHEDDPAGRAMREGGWHVIRIQMEFSPGDPLNHPDDPRTEAGELMFPARFPRAEIDKLKAPNKLGRHYSAQYQQCPTAEEGTYFQRMWVEGEGLLYDVAPDTRKYMASDYAVTLPREGREPDYTEHGIFGYGADRHVYVLDWWGEQTTSDKWALSWIELAKKWKPMAVFGEGGVIWNSVEPTIRKIMEEKRVHLRVEILTSIADKAARGRSFQAMASMKQIHFPRNAPWSQRVINQCVGFPTDRFDDAFDVMSLMCRAIADAHPAIVKMPAGPAKPRDYDFAPEESGESWKTV